MPQDMSTCLIVAGPPHSEGEVDGRADFIIVCHEPSDPRNSRFFRSCMHVVVEADYDPQQKAREWEANHLNFLKAVSLLLSFSTPSACLRGRSGCL